MRSLAIPASPICLFRARAATFYFDLGSPYAYLTAERISGLFTEAELEQPEWQPILLGGLFQRFDRDSWAQTGRARAEGMAEVERRAAAYGLPPLVWPEPWPGNTLIAMRVATFAKQTGRTVSFALAAFRQAFAAGRDLDRPRQRDDRRRRLRAAPAGAAESGRRPRSSRTRCARRPTRPASRGVDRRPGAGRRRARSSGATTELEEAVEAAS